jgi:hypothetical protein
MCQSLFIGKRELTQIGDLLKLVGRRKIVIRDGCAPWARSDYCLCGVDLQATAKLAGYEVISDPQNDVWGVTWRKAVSRPTEPRHARFASGARNGPPEP